MVQALVHHSDGTGTSAQTVPMEHQHGNNIGTSAHRQCQHDTEECALCILKFNLIFYSIHQNVTRSNMANGDDADFIILQTTNAHGACLIQIMR